MGFQYLSGEMVCVHVCVHFRRVHVHLCVHVCNAKGNTKFYSQNVPSCVCISSVHTCVCVFIPCTGFKIAAQCVHF